MGIKIEKVGQVSAKLHSESPPLKYIKLTEQSE